MSQKNLTGSRCHWGMDMLAFAFLGENPAVFAGKNPRILFMAKRQKTQEAVLPPCLLRTVRFFYIIEKFLLIIVKFTFFC